MMASFKDLTSVWKNIKEIDLQAFEQAASHRIKIQLVGAPGSGRHALAEQMRRDPHRSEMHTSAPLMIAAIDPPPAVGESDLVILLVDGARPDFSTEQQLAQQWVNAGKQVLLLCNLQDGQDANHFLGVWQSWPTADLLCGSVVEVPFLQREFVPLVIDRLSEQHLALGRQFPLFRVPLAQRLIYETCLANATYALSTGLGEMVPGLNIPLTLADLIVLTKSQAFLTYKLGLLLGYSTRWQDYVKEFSGVIGSGFIWRQIARTLIGLIPAWGIIPKVAVAYAGTYVVGNAVLQWYLTGRHLSRAQMQALYYQALAAGKKMAQKIRSRPPLPRVSGRTQLQLSPGETAEMPRSKRQKPRRERKAKQQPELPPQKDCPDCGRQNAWDSRYCQYCGRTFDQKGV